MKPGMLPPRPPALRLLSLFASVVLLLIATITSLSPEYAPPDRYNADKFIHTGFYFLFTFLWLYGAARRKWSRCLAAATAVFFYGAIIELLQQYVGGRTTSISDIAANGLGVALAVLFKTTLTGYVSGFRARKPNKSSF